MHFRAGYSLMEMLVVITVVGVLLGLVAVTPRVMSTSRRVTALQEVTAALDAARSQALRDNVTVYAAFTNTSLQAPFDPLRQYALFEETVDATGTVTLQQLSEWRTLTDGVLFNDAVTASSGVNLLSEPTAVHDVPLGPLGQNKTASLPCIGFGPQGDVVFPPDIAGPFLIYMAEGSVVNGQLSVGNSKLQQALEVRRGTGKSYIQP